MKPPFTTEQFLAIFTNYNVAVFPMQIIFYFIAFWIIYLVFKPNAKSDKIISVVLAFFWFWMGIVYQIIFFTEINKLAYVFGGLFIFQGLLFIVFGIFQNKFSFQFKNNIYGITGMTLIAFSLIIYPILGCCFGHTYPNSPTFGLPCPTTIFTFGMLLMNQKKFPILILIIPFIWSVIGYTAVFQFGILEDSSLLMTSLIAFALLLYRNRKFIIIPNK